MPREVEWPPGSGRKATYEDHEVEFMQALRKQHDAGEITDEVFANQFRTIHDLKVEFGVTLPKDDDPEVQQESLFEIPPTARRLLDERRERERPF